MKHRRKSRELALQILYSFETNEKPLEELYQDEMFTSTPEQHRAFAKILIEGCLQHKKNLHEEIEKILHNWKLNRLAALDLVILRMALFEMKYLDDVPAVVSINEAIDLAKKFSTSDSGAFINGILDRFRKQNLDTGNKPEN
jgi:transcription antitermination factor NusB